VNAVRRGTVVPVCLAVMAAAVVFAVLVTTGAVAHGGTVEPAVLSRDEAAAELAGLRVAAAAPAAGYRRDAFAVWADQGGGCDTRELVLRRDGSGVTVGAACHPTAGRWHSRYDARTITTAAGLQIDHVVPLAAAWRSGARGWSAATRAAFGNDLTGYELLAVSAATNQAKGDRDPSTWKPPNAGEWCDYAGRWISVKHRWHLTATRPEVAALNDMLSHC
jgi:hypothetical protein